MNGWGGFINSSGTFSLGGKHSGTKALKYSALVPLCFDGLKNLWFCGHAVCAIGLHRLSIFFRLKNCAGMGLKNDFRAGIMDLLEG